MSIPICQYVFTSVPRKNQRCTFKRTATTLALKPPAWKLCIKGHFAKLVRYSSHNVPQGNWLN